MLTIEKDSGKHTEKYNPENTRFNIIWHMIYIFETHSQKKNADLGIEKKMSKTKDQKK
jgi:hypothetical protein